MRRRLLSALIAMMLVVGLMPAMPAMAIVGYTVSGSVVNGADAPVEKARIQLLDSDYNPVNQMITGADGLFSFPDVPNGEYIVASVSYEGEIFAEEWITVEGGDYPDVVLLDEAGVRSQFYFIDDFLGGVPATNVWYEASSEDDYYEGRTDEDGFIEIYGNWDSVQFHVPTGYEEQPVIEPFVAPVNSTINIGLADDAGWLEGTVKDAATGNPITRDFGLDEEPISADIYRYDAEWDYWDTAGWFDVDEDATFKVPTMSGDALIKFYDQEGDYASEFYDDAVFQAGATSVEVTAGAGTTITPMLDAAATVAGAVTSSGGWHIGEDYETWVEAWAYNPDSEEWEYVLGDSQWGIGANYLVGRLPAGSYKIAAFSVLVDAAGHPRMSNGEPIYSEGWFKSGATLPFSGWADMMNKVSLAETVTVTVGQDVVGKNFVFAPPSSKVNRIAGATRFDVAANLARKGWDPENYKSWDEVEHVIIANGENGKEADPLAAAGLAGQYDCPVLLTAAGSLPASTKAVITEIARARKADGGTLRVHLIGGTTSLPDARWNQIRVIPGVNQTKDRLAGADRYAVSVTIAKRILALNDNEAEWLGGVLIVAGDNSAAFFDALAASPFAYQNSMPMLSVKKGAVPPVVASLLAGSLKGSPRYVVNSTGYVSDFVKSKVGATKRLATSTNRYLAATQIATFGITNDWASVGDVSLGAKLPDALTGGVFTGKRRGVMVFTDSSTLLQPYTKSFITAKKTQIGSGWVLGGNMSVTTAVEGQYRNLIK